MKRIHKRTGIRCLIIALLSAGILFGCSCSSQNTSEEKTVVKVLWTTGIENFERYVEDTYSDIDIQWERVSSVGEMSRRLSKNNGPDLLIYEQIDIQEMQQYNADLSALEMVSRYDGTMIKQLQIDGKIYALPLPGQYSGYIINETLFEQANLPIPTSNDELLASLETLKEQGLGVGEDGVNFYLSPIYNSLLGNYVAGYCVPDFLGTVEGEQWLQNYNNKEGSMVGHFEAPFDFLFAARDAGVMDDQAITRQHKTIEYENRMADGTLAVVYGDTSMYRTFEEYNKQQAEAGTAQPYTYRMLPMLSDEGQAPWMLLTPSGYVGINASSDDAVQEACVRILDLLSSQEGQKAMLNDIQSGHSYLTDYESSTAGMPNGLEQYLNSGYIYNLHFNNNVLEYAGEVLRQVMKEDMTVEEGLAAIDEYNKYGSDAIDFDLSVVGQVAHDMVVESYNTRLGETEMGNFVADCVAEAASAPIAVVNGGGIRSSLYAGDVLGSDLSAVCPFDNTIVVLDMNGQTLIDMLENGLVGYPKAVTRDDDPNLYHIETEEVFPAGRFLQVSGITYTFDSALPEGQRIQSVTLADGTPIDPDATYTVAVNNYMAGARGYAENNGDGFTMLNCYDDATPQGEVTLVNETNLTYCDAMKLYFEKHGDDPVQGALEGRIVNLAF